MQNIDIVVTKYYCWLSLSICFLRPRKSYLERVQTRRGTKDGETFQSLPPVPVAAEEYCAAAIDGDRIFVTSLGDNKDDAYIFSRRSNEWETLPNMPTGRYHDQSGQ